MKNKIRILFNALILCSGFFSFAQDDPVKNLKQYELPDSSIESYKKNKKFAYIKNLDSLLKRTSGLMVDTFSLSVESPVTRKKRSKENTAPLPISPVNNLFTNLFVKILLWIIAIAFIGFILYKFFSSDILFRRNIVVKSISATTKEEEDITDPFVYDRLISDAAGNKDYRLAVRFLYLKTLKLLIAKGLIQFSADRTNYKYIDELAGTPYQKKFAAITLHYEYVWYGKFDLSENIYNKLFTDFKLFHQKL